MWRDLGAALALLLVLEGMLPFVSPGALRRALTAMNELSDRQLRLVGLTSMLLGLLFLAIVNH
jgi:uncharacterized protein